MTTLTVIQRIRSAMWEFQFHYALEAEELYLSEKDFTALLVEVSTIWGDEKYGFNLIESGKATLFGMMLYRHSGPTMLIHRKENTVWGWIGNLGSKGVYHHVVLGDEEFAMYSEVPR